MAEKHGTADGNGYHPEDDADYSHGLDDYHDPTGGIGGAPPARSALTLRMWLAAFGFLTCALITFIAGIEGIRWLSVVAAVFAAIAAVDFVWISQRKRRGEPG
jgi:dolichyl-phosphate-mannose--protein O-mannosyl transferase